MANLVPLWRLPGPRSAPNANRSEVSGEVKAKMAPSWAKLEPRRSKLEPSWHQDGPILPQDGQLETILGGILVIFPDPGRDLSKNYRSVKRVIWISGLDFRFRFQGINRAIYNGKTNI